MTTNKKVTIYASDAIEELWRLTGDDRKGGNRSARLSDVAKFYIEAIQTLIKSLPFSFDEWILLKRVAEENSRIHGVRTYSVFFLQPALSKTHVEDLDVDLALFEGKVRALNQFQRSAVAEVLRRRDRDSDFDDYIGFAAAGISLPPKRIEGLTLEAVKLLYEMGIRDGARPTYGLSDDRDRTFVSKGDMIYQRENPRLWSLGINQTSYRLFFDEDTVLLLKDKGLLSEIENPTGKDYIAYALSGFGRLVYKKWTEYVGDAVIMRETPQGMKTIFPGYSEMEEI